MFTDWEALEVLEQQFIALLDAPAEVEAQPLRATVPGRGPRPTSPGSSMGLGTRRAPGYDPAPEPPSDAIPPTSVFAVPELSTDEVTIACQPLTDPARLRDITAGVASIPGVASVTLESAVGARATLRVGLERPVALGAELLTHLAHQISACRYVDGRLEVDVVVGPAAIPS